MPHSDGYIYEETRNNVKYGASQQDIAAVLGASNLTTGALCSHSNINKWAWCKPESGHTEMGLLTDAMRIDMNFGLKVPTAGGTVADAAERIKSGVTWEYIKLTSKDWARQNDFVGYYHYASHPFPVSPNRRVNIQNVGEKLSLGLERTFYRNVDITEMKDEDGRDLSDYCAAAILVNDFGRYVQAVADVPLSSEDEDRLTVRVYKSSLPSLTGTYTCYPCLYNKEDYVWVPFEGQSFTLNLYSDSGEAIGGENAVSFTNVFVTGKLNKPSSFGMEGQIVVENGTTGTVTLRNITITASWVDNWGDTHEASIGISDGGGITLAKGAKHSFEMETIARGVWTGTGLYDNRPGFFADTEYLITIQMFVNGKSAIAGSSINTIEL